MTEAARRRRGRRPGRSAPGRVALDDEPLFVLDSPGAKRPRPAGAASGEETGDGAGPAAQNDSGRAGRPASLRDPGRPAFRWPAHARAAQRTIVVMGAMAAARAGRVADLDRADGSLALTRRTDGTYELTEQALVPTPWRPDVQRLLDNLA